ncbi:hypothetical protein WJX81_006266 [Elliptochloris bilobata]|uniref:Major facilitator superfamily (MFS) profile domain-containing protein n=1 Tax=Elliptochloris bilobata TaxID=381761 RepID=A0AAW1QKB6_9CHLO
MQQQSHFEIEESRQQPSPTVVLYAERPPSARHAVLLWLQGCGTSVVLPGLGMFSEAYFIFAIGNLRPVFDELYGECFKTHTACSRALVASQTYTQVAGIMLGMLSLGVVADLVGRRAGSLICAAFMLGGGVLLTCSSGPTLNAWALVFAVSQFIYGVGVGGEYPLASSSAAERAEADEAVRARRGEMIVCTFAMQGWGNLVNTAVICALLALFGQTGGAGGYQAGALAAVWRLSFAVGLVPLVGMLAYRIAYVKESEMWSRTDRPSEEVWRERAALVTHFWHRLLGTAGAWFFWDVSFYSNKLFQSAFIAIIAPGASILTGLLWTLLNSFVALVGYYVAALTIDKPCMGRVRMQVMGFVLVAAAFLACAAGYDTLVQPGGIPAFQALYLLSSFFGQFGPNATTWMLPGEVFPTEARATCHGASAAAGKAGALLAGAWFGALPPARIFGIAAAFNLAGAALTAVFVPDVLGLDLREGDARWEALKAGRPYAGAAASLKNLSLFERWASVGSQAGGKQPAVELAGKAGSDAARLLDTES